MPGSVNIDRLMDIAVRSGEPDNLGVMRAVLSASHTSRTRRSEPDDLVCAACDRTLTMAEYVERYCSGCGARLKREAGL